LIYYRRSRAGEIFLLTVYAKNQKEDLSHEDKKQIRALIAEIEKHAPQIPTHKAWP
jgi:hypothetical protein